MVSKIKDFGLLISRADSYLDQGRHLDASHLYRTALRTSGGSETDRLLASGGLGVCCRALGLMAEALAIFGENYRASLHSAPMQEIAFYSLHGQIETVRQLREIEEPVVREKCVALLEIIDNGVRWIRDIDREGWLPSILRQRSIVLEFLGDSGSALEVAEQALRIAKKYGDQGQIGACAEYVSRMAGIQGGRNRAIEVLDQIPEPQTDYNRLFYLMQRSRALAYAGLVRASERHEVTRRLGSIADRYQGNWDRLFAYQELAESSAVVKSLHEMRDAVGLMREITLADDTVLRVGMLRVLRRRLRASVNHLRQVHEARSAELAEVMESWSNLADVELQTELSRPSFLETTDRLL